MMFAHELALDVPGRGLAMSTRAKDHEAKKPAFGGLTVDELKFALNSNLHFRWGPDASR